MLDLSLMYFSKSLSSRHEWVFSIHSCAWFSHVFLKPFDIWNRSDAKTASEVPAPCATIEWHLQSCWIFHCKLFFFIRQCHFNRLLKSVAVLLTFYKKRGVNPEFMIIIHLIIRSGVIIFRRHTQQMLWQPWT